MIVLNKEQIIYLHKEIIDATGGSPEIRDEGLLESAINSPFQTFNGNELYPTIQQKGARLGFSLTNNHSFIDGNKRIGAHSMLVFLELNGIKLNYSQKELYTIFLDVASDKCNYNDLLNWIINHQV